MRYILVAFLIGAGPVAQAQTMVLAPMPVALDDLNSAFHGTVTFKLNGKGQLIADHFDASGRFRQDVMLVEHLDTASVAWSAEENAIVVKCGGSDPQCIDKEIFKLGSIKHTGRSNMAFGGDERQREEAMKALRNVLVQEQQNLAALDRATRGGTSRKN
jgi:hypothetical protein